MTPEQWRRVREVLEEALELDVARRAAFLDEACADDVELRRRVEALLASENAMGEFLSQPLVSVGSGLGDGGGALAGVGAVPELPTELMDGRRIGHYQILREIGRGGMGTVHLAERADGVFRKRVAIKLVKPELGAIDMLRRFRTERRVLATLDHPNIARLLDGGVTEDSLSYLVMEYVEGERIDSWCDKRKLPVRDRLKLFRTVCAAVQYAHDRQVIHRDLKPDNILVTAEGTPKLLDFGIAKVLNPELNAELCGQTTETTLGPGPMTPEYASPEQVRGERVGPATDIYSLGMVLYRLLTGRLAYPVRGGDLRQIAKMICELDAVKPSGAIVGTELEVGRQDTSEAAVTPESVSKARAETPAGLRRQLTGDLDNIVLKTLRKEPERRYASVAELSADLDRYLQDRPVQARKETPWYGSQKFLKRNRAALVAAAFTAALFLVFTATRNRFGRSGDGVYTLENGTSGPRASTAFWETTPKPRIAAALTANPEALRAYEEGLSERTRFRQAETVKKFERAIQLDPQFVMAHYYLAETMAFQGKVPEARRMIARALQLAAQTPAPRLEKLLVQALQLRLDLKLDEAAKVLETAQREFPREIEPFFQMADLRSAEGRFAEAAALFEKVIRMDERQAQAHDQLGYQYGLQGDLARGLAAIDRYAALLPSGNEAPFASRGDVYLLNDRYSDAIAQYRKINHTVPTAIAAAYSADYELAESMFKTGLRRPSDGYEATGDLAAAHGQLDRAAIYYEQAAKLYQIESPLRPWWAMLRVARIFLEQRQPENVLDLSRRFNNPWSAGLRGTAYLILHKEAAAETEFVALRNSIAPILGDSAAEAAIALHRMEAASYDGHFDRVIQMWPKLPRSWWGLYALEVGRAYLRSDLFTEAEHYLQAASKAQLAFFRNPDMEAQHDFLTWMLAQFYIAQLLEKTGRQTEAIANYQAFLRHFEHTSARLPQIDVAREALVRWRFSERGKLILGDEFSGTKLEPGWFFEPGTWKLDGGFIKLLGRPADHQTTCKRMLAFHNAIFELSFQLDGATLALVPDNGKNVGRCSISPTRMWLRFRPDPSVPLRKLAIVHLDTAIKPGEWHKIVVEVLGKRMIAQLDGRQTIADESSGLDVDKTGFWLTVNGGSASVDYVRVYEVNPAARSKLTTPDGKP